MCRLKCIMHIAQKNNEIVRGDVCKRHHEKPYH